MTDLLYSDVEDQLRASARDLLSARAPWADVLKRTETVEPYDAELWRTLATDVGVAGLAVPESLGGHGASWREVAVIAEELGRSGAATPFLGSAVLATALAMAAGAEDVVRSLASGQRIAAVVVAADSAPGAAYPANFAMDGERVSGSMRNVVDAVAADVFLVPVFHGDVARLVAIDASAGRREQVVSLDLTRPVCDLAFDGAHCTVLATGDPAVAALDRALTVGAALLASEQLGLAERCLEMTVEYLKSRYQFGRPIGGYQALKHRMADVWAGVTQARAVARYAAGCVADHDPDAAVAASLAQAYCSGVAVKAAEECVQLHGGIGFTWEHPAHLYLKRAKADAITLGTAATHRARLATLVDLPAT